MISRIVFCVILYQNFQLAFLPCTRRLDESKMSAEEGITSELLEHTCTSHHAKTVERIVKRCMALVMELIPMQVDEGACYSKQGGIHADLKK